MTSNYGIIREENIREYGEGTRHLSFLGRLYTDRTHFIFELLQNAEDTRATRIRFQLFGDRLEVRHDGRLFDERDVRGICGIDERTKADDLTQIGKFGIGFKSVYAFTRNPEVHSGDEHFRIENFVRPFHAARQKPGHPWTTLFVFPFDIPELDQAVCHDEIAARLRNLSVRTLLFLHSLEEIEYVVDDDLPRGVYLREVIDRGPAQQVTVFGQNSNQEEYETWLVFGRKVAIPDRNDFVSVETAFRIEPSVGEQAERIVKVDDSPLSVYFPTEKPTRFGFLVQGPFQTTPSRDNVPKNSSWNTALIEQTAVLIQDVLAHLKEMGFLTVEALLALPIRVGDFPKDGMFFPIANAVHSALKNQEFLPADDGTHVSARRARLARSAELRRLLPNDLLTSMLKAQEDLKWLSGEITHDRAQTRDLHGYLLNHIGVNEIDPEAFARNLSEDFLAARDDCWFVNLYEFLLEQESLWRKPKYVGQTRGVLRSRPIIRLDDDTLIVPFDSTERPTAYLPIDSLSGFRFVKRSIAHNEQALTFLKRLGLSEPDAIANVIETILPKYRSAQRECIGEAEYRSDLAAILGALKTDSQQEKLRLIEEARKTPFVRTVNAATGEQGYRRPDEVYLPTPELRVFFDDNSGAWFLPDSIDTLGDDWKELGAASLPRRIVHSRRPDTVNEFSHWLPEIINYDLEGLRHFLDYLAQMPTQSQPAVQRGVVLWQILVNCLKEKSSFFDGTYKWFYYRWKTKTFASDFQVLLRSCAWVPTSGGECKIPSECYVDELHPNLDQDDKLLKSLGVRPSEHESRTKLLTELHAYGYDEGHLRVLELLRQHPDEIDRLTQRLASLEDTTGSHTNPRFPTRASRDPERREKGVTEEVLDAPDKEYEQRQRSVRTTRPDIDQNVWLRSHYTNDDQQLVCQICKDVMPFKKRDGEYYFEAVEALNGDHFSKEYEAQFLALCPVCAAKYTEFVKRDPGVMAQVANSLSASQEPEVPLLLGDWKTSLRFVDVHFRDLKTILLLNGRGASDSVSADETARRES